MELYIEKLINQGSIELAVEVDNLEFGSVLSNKFNPSISDVHEEAEVIRFTVRSVEVSVSNEDSTKLSSKQREKIISELEESKEFLDDVNSEYLEMHVKYKLPEYFNLI